MQEDCDVQEFHCVVPPSRRAFEPDPPGRRGYIRFAIFLQDNGGGLVPAFIR